MKKSSILDSLGSDIIFKEIFGTEKNIRFTELLLETLKNMPHGSLKDKVTILNSSPLNKTNIQNKSVSADILVSIPGEVINIEVYGHFDEEKFTKSKVYFFRLYATDLPVGEEYAKQHIIIQYNICLTSSLPYTKKLKTRYLLRDDTNEIVAHDIKGYIYNLDKLEVNSYTVGESNLLEKIFLIIKATTHEEREQIAEGSEILMDMVNTIKKFINDEEIKEMKSFQNKWLDEGCSIGKQNEKISVAKKLLNKLSLDDIVEVTGLTKSEIESLAKN